MKIKCIDTYEVFEKFENYFDRKRKLAFFSALLIGAITYCFFLAKLFMSPDGVMFSIAYSAGDFEASLGRWGIDFIDNIRADRAVSSVSSMLSILIAASGCVLLADLFQFQKNISIILTSAAVMVSPALAITLLYQYCSDAYMCAFFFAVLSAYCVHKIRNPIAGIGLSALLLCGAISIYQNYMGVMVGICIILVLLECINPEKNLTDLLHSAGRKVTAILSGGVLYYVITQLIYLLGNIQPDDYKGVDQISPAGILSSLGGSVIEAYRKFKQYFLNDTCVYNIKWQRDRMFVIFFILLLIAVLGYIIINGLYKEWQRMLMIGLCLILLPLGMNAVFLIVPKADLYALNSMQLVLVFPLLFGLLEKFEIRKFVLVKWGSFLISFAILFTYYLAANYSYAYMDLSYNQMCSVSEKIVDRMQTTEGYRPDMQCAIAGILTDEYFPRDKAYTGYTICNIVEGSVLHGDYICARESWRKFILNYQGENLNFCDPVKYEEIVKSDAFKQMGVFPQADSVKIMDDIVVVKLTEDPPMP